MSYPNLTRSLLALAIAGASVHVSAETIVIPAEGIELKDQTYNSSLTVTGDFRSNGDAFDGFELEDSTVKGDLILDAKVITESGYESFDGPSNPSSEPIKYPRNAEPVEIERSDIDGSVINKGHLENSGWWAETLEVENSTIGGNIVNEGTIIARGPGFDEFYGDIDYRNGLVIERTEIKGNLENKGDIEVGFEPALFTSID